MGAKQEVTGNVATSVLFENERVKVWEMDLKPGEDTDMHYHSMDYLLVIIDGDRIAGIPPEDSGQEVIDAPVEAGQVFYVPKGGTELARNTGTKRYREILIELKD
jgi:beta-alanine degradation protein BauB